MKVEHNYICEKCGAVYKEEVNALNCEDHHELPVKVEYNRYFKGRKYPHLVTVTFNDGRRYNYSNAKIQLLEEFND